MDKAKLDNICKEMRKDILLMADAAGDSGLHFGGSLSLIEIIATLYLEVMNIHKEKFSDEHRDRMILSKGHGVPAIYSVLRQMGVLTKDDLMSFKCEDTVLFGHPCINPQLGIEFSTGSLGQGLSLGVGCALALRHHGNTTSRVFVILGDGECDEGSVWEAAMSASKFKLNNIVLIIDKNNIQYDDNTEIIMPLNSLMDKWRSFGWAVITIDGHNVLECKEALSSLPEEPLCVIANTIKGKGISFMEGEPSWHHAKMTKTQREQAWEELANA